jgi:hypothetical protein
MDVADEMKWCVGGPLDGAVHGGDTGPEGYTLLLIGVRGLLSGRLMATWCWVWPGIGETMAAELLESWAARELGRRVGGLEYGTDRTDGTNGRGHTV